MSERTQIQVSRIHILIHPGFGSDYRAGDASMEEARAYEPLLHLYLEQAKQMTPDEIMLACTHTDTFKSDLAQGYKYAQAMVSLKGILRNRLYLGTDTSAPKFTEFFEHPAAIRHAFNALARRGFTFGGDVSTVGYGESLGNCVSEGANNINTTMGFTHPTLLIPELSDLALEPEHKRRELIDGIERDNTELGLNRVVIGSLNDIRKVLSR